MTFSCICNVPLALLQLSLWVIFPVPLTYCDMPVLLVLTCDASSLASDVHVKQVLLIKRQRVDAIFLQYGNVSMCGDTCPGGR